LQAYIMHVAALLCQHAHTDTCTPGRAGADERFPGWGRYCNKHMHAEWLARGMSRCRNSAQLKHDGITGEMAVAVNGASSLPYAYNRVWDVTAG